MDRKDYPKSCVGEGPKISFRHDTYANHPPERYLRVHTIMETAAFSSFNRCNIAKHGLIVSRLKTALCSGNITAISGNIVSHKKRVRQKRYNRAFYRPGFSSGRTGVIKEIPNKPLPGIPQRPEFLLPHSVIVVTLPNTVSKIPV